MRVVLIRVVLIQAIYAFTLPRSRNCLTPLAIGSFILMLATGIVTFFEQYSLGIKTIVHHLSQLLSVQKIP